VAAVSNVMLETAIFWCQSSHSTKFADILLCNSATMSRHCSDKFSHHKAIANFRLGIKTRYANKTNWLLSRQQQYRVLKPLSHRKYLIITTARSVLKRVKRAALWLSPLSEILRTPVNLQTESARQKNHIAISTIKCSLQQNHWI